MPVRSFWNRTRARTAIAALAWCGLFAAWSLSDGSASTKFGLPLHAVIAMPLLLPLFVVTMVLFTYVQNRDEWRSRDDG